MSASEPGLVEWPDDFECPEGHSSVAGSCLAETLRISMRASFSLDGSEDPTWCREVLVSIRRVCSRAVRPPRRSFEHLNAHPMRWQIPRVSFRASGRVAAPKSRSASFTSSLHSPNVSSLRTARALELRRALERPLSSGLGVRPDPLEFRVIDWAPKSTARCRLSTDSSEKLPSIGLELKGSEELSRPISTSVGSLRARRSRLSSVPHTRRCAFPTRTFELGAHIGSSTHRPSVGFRSLRRILVRAATHAELASLDCAAPSGFFNLLTPYSAHTASALFRAESALGICAFRGFPLPVAATAFTAPCPSATAPPSSGPPAAPKSCQRHLTVGRSHDPSATPGTRIVASGRSVHSRAVLPLLYRPFLS